VLARIDTAFTAVFCVELLVRMWALGWHHFVRSTWRCVDAAIVALLLVRSRSRLWRRPTRPMALSAYASLGPLRAVRAIQAVRLLRGTQRTRKLASAFVAVLPIAGRLLLLTFAVLYSYVVVGLEVFGGGATAICAGVV
jgi:hypothetical protein